MIFGNKNCVIVKVPDGIMTSQTDSKRAENKEEACLEGLKCLPYILVYKPILRIS